MTANVDPMRAIARAIIPFRLRRAVGIGHYELLKALTRLRDTAGALRLRRHLSTHRPVIPRDDASGVLAFPRSDHPRVSIVVPAFNHWTYTHLCLRALRDHTSGQEFEVILADDGSSDTTIAASTLLRNVQVVRQDRSLGFLKNCNAAARCARGEYLLFLNNDTVVQRGWLDILVGTADRNPEVGIVGPKVIYPDGRLQDAGGIVFADGTTANYGRGGDPAAAAFNVARDVDYISGCCLLVRRELWSSVGGFDDRFAPGYYEDVDLAFAARRRGYRVVYEPRAVIVHFDGVSHGHNTSTGIKSFLAVNAEKFVLKWPEIVESAQACESGKDAEAVIAR